MKSVDLYNIEELIMRCWNTKEDIELLCDSILDGKVSYEEIANTLLGLSMLHELRCRKLFSTYEKCISNNVKNKKTTI